MRILNNIIFLLKEQKKTQKDITNYLGLSKNIFTDWKSGKCKSYKKYLPQIAEFFGCSVDYLLGINSDIPKHSGSSIDIQLTEHIGKLIKSDDEWAKRFIINFLTLSPQEREMFKRLFPDISET